MEPRELYILKSRLWHSSCVQVTLYSGPGLPDMDQLKYVSYENIGNVYLQHGPAGRRRIEHVLCCEGNAVKKTEVAIPRESESDI